MEAGLASAAKTFTGTYETPAQYHNAMEPHAAVASWDGDKLHLFMPTQGLAIAQGGSRGSSASSPPTSTSTAPISAAASARRVPAGPQVLACMAARLTGKP